MKKMFCQSGGCSAKLGAGALSKILNQLPPFPPDPQLLVGFDSRDDGAIYQVDENIAVIQTVDFFPPMVDDPFVFGKIAAANALSDIYAMGGSVKTALNLVCFPETMDFNVLGEILAGGAEKVAEAEGVLVGGHSIHDKELKYGMSVMGLVHPRKFYRNDSVQLGDHLLLTKKLGTGILTTANSVGEAPQEGIKEAIDSMCMLNKYASISSEKYKIHACTDVTGFGLLGHLHEMMADRFSCEIWQNSLPILHSALDCANEFLLTAGGQRNRNYLEKFTSFTNVSFAMEEILFDPQTSGGLLFSLSPEESEIFCKELKESGIPAEIIGEVQEKTEKELIIK